MIESRYIKGKNIGHYQNVGCSLFIRWPLLHSGLKTPEKSDIFPLLSCVLIVCIKRRYVACNDVSIKKYKSRQIRLPESRQSKTIVSKCRAWNFESESVKLVSVNGANLSQQFILHEIHMEVTHCMWKCLLKNILYWGQRHVISQLSLNQRAFCAQTF